MAKALPMTKEIVDFAKKRISQIEAEVSKGKEEMAVWKAVLARIKPCDDCGGAGEYRAFIAPDETDVLECEKCGGKGVLA